MNYYDEEITVSGPDTRQLSGIKVDRLPSRGGSSAGGGRPLSGVQNAGGGSTTSAARPVRARTRSILHGGNSMEDDGLLQDIIIDEDEDDDDDGDDDEDDDSDLQKPGGVAGVVVDGGAATQRPSLQQKHQQLQQQQQKQRRQGSLTQLQTAAKISMVAHDTGGSETDSEEAAAAVGKIRGAAGGGTLPKKTKRLSLSSSTSPDDQQQQQLLSLTPDSWDALGLPQEVKDLFPYILKYTPQHIETPHRLQPFIPDYVPAVGDVDAFLKVSVPPLPQPQQRPSPELDSHLSRMGLHYLDEPCGEQSEPSLLNMKLRSLLTGSSVNPRSASASLIPTAKSTKDIDKWIVEVEQVHMSQSSAYDAQPRKDIEALLLDWPRTFAAAAASEAAHDAYQRCVRDELPLAEYIRVLCRCFEVDGPCETQADFILNVHTLFAMFLAAANQTW